MIQTIDGALFARMMIHASAAISAQKQQINELNVFPVPDGDTGTNMSMTISAAAEELNKKPYPQVGAAANATANALLRGARGNSGVILSLLFRGFAKAVKDKETMDGRDFAIALDFGVAAAYKAVMKPAEGTILTVSRLSAAAAAAAAREDAAIESVLEKAIAEGLVALENTTEQNPVLKKAGVVDSGGKGFLVILQGMLDELQGKPMPEGADLPQKQEKADFAALDTKTARTAGERAYLEQGLTGARGEAAKGFPSVREVALPALSRALEAGLNKNDAGTIALLHLIAQGADTNMAARGGLERAKKAAEDCARLLERCPLPEVEDISRLDQEFIRDNLSPGGCADLLAASFFIAKWKDLG